MRLLRLGKEEQRAKRSGGGEGGGEERANGVEAAFRYNCSGSSKKALVLILELIERLELR